MHKQSSIYKLLEIKPSSGKMFFILFPPIYCLWLLAFGKTLLFNENKSDKLFTFFATATVVGMFASFLAGPLFALLDVDLRLLGAKAIPVILPFYFFWFGTLGILTRITVQFDREANPDHHYNTANILDYVRRFLAFFYWPFTMWHLQRIAHGYISDRRPSS